MGQIYKCACGYAEPNNRTFATHLLSGARKDGKGVHKSLGIFDDETGEIIRKPWNDLNAEEKLAEAKRLGISHRVAEKMASKNGSNPDDSDVSPGSPTEPTPKDKSKKPQTGSSRVTTDASVATAITFRPRIIEVDYDPIIRAGQIAARDLWGWDVPLDVFLRRIVRVVFADRDIDLDKPYVVRTQGNEEVTNAG